MQCDEIVSRINIFLHNNTYLLISVVAFKIICFQFLYSETSDHTIFEAVCYVHSGKCVL